MAETYDLAIVGGGINGCGVERTRAGEILGSARSWADLGISFGAGLTEAEVDYLAREEWAMTAEDIVFRRSKLGLKLATGDIAALDRFLEGKRRSLAG